MQKQGSGICFVDALGGEPCSAMRGIHHRGNGMCTASSSRRPANVRYIDMAAVAALPLPACHGTWVKKEVDGSWCVTYCEICCRVWLWC